MHSCPEILFPGPLAPLLCPVLQPATWSLAEGLGLPTTGRLSWSSQADSYVAMVPQDPCQTAAHMAYLYVMLMGFPLPSRGAVAFVLDHFTVGFCPWACLPRPSWLPICLSKVLAPACPLPPDPFLSQTYTHSSLPTPNTRFIVQRWF